MHEPEKQAQQYLCHMLILTYISSESNKRLTLYLHERTVHSFSLYSNPGVRIDV